MNTAIDSHTRTCINALSIAPLFRWMLIAALMCGLGLLFVFVKNQQHQLGAKTREVERQLHEERSLNEVLRARISALSSRGELQRKLQSGMIALQPIPATAIARLTSPVEADTLAVARTAANDRALP